MIKIIKECYCDRCGEKIPEDHAFHCGTYPNTAIATNYKCSSIDDIFKGIEEFMRQQMECREKTLAEIIQKYDFIVGSKECEHKLMELLPKGVNIIFSPYFVNPTIIYAIKKFDVSDLIETNKEVHYETDM
jgi:hypothetical protein